MRTKWYVSRVVSYFLIKYESGELESFVSREYGMKSQYESHRTYVRNEDLSTETSH